MNAGRAEVFLTGGTGFIGGHVLRALLAHGYRVRALVRDPPENPRPRRDTREKLRPRPGVSSISQLEGCSAVRGDLLESGPLARAMEGCRYLVHVAALYSFRPQDRPKIWKTNVGGTIGLLEAARIAGIEKGVMTSSSATIEPGLTGSYHASKSEQERAALAAQLPVVLVLPTAPVGPGDWKPTPTGQMILDFIRGRIFGSVTGGINIVDVDDVAHAHVLALEHGQPGRRYVVGGEDLTFEDLWARLARVSGRKAPRLKVPAVLALLLGFADEARCRLQSGSRPFVPLEGVRMARHFMYADSRRAQQDLGYRARPIDDALAQAVAWYRAYGYT